MTSGTQQQNTYMTNGEAWNDWQPDTTGVDQWGMELTHAYPGVREDEGVSSDASTSTDTSSDSGNEVLDMSDLQGMTEQEAAENVILQYRHYCPLGCHADIRAIADEVATLLDEAFMGLHVPVPALNRWATTTLS